jgi:hypothetical protein
MRIKLKLAAKNDLGLPFHQLDTIHSFSTQR